MLTVLLIFLPLVAAVVVSMLKGSAARVAAIIASLAELGVAIAALAQFDIHGGTQNIWLSPWIPQLGITFKVGIDGISMLMVLLTAAMTPLIILTTLKREIKQSGVYFALVLAMQAGLMGVFTAMDGFLFYIFWEVVLIPIYFICLLWGGENRVRVTLKFFIYTLAGSLLMLVALIYMYYQTPGAHSFDLAVLSSLHLSAREQGFIFWALFIAFAVKMPVFPFHTWQPDTYTEAPASGTMLLSALMSKMGVYAVLRILLPLAPMGVAQYGKYAAVLAVIGIVYASFIALRQNDWKRLIAYSSIAHIGLIAAGVFTLSVVGIQGALIQMVSHGINAVALFFIIDIIEQRTNSRTIGGLGGIRLAAPILAGYFLIATLANVSLPLTNSFVGEFLLLNGVFQYNYVLAAFAGLGTILSAWYMLAAYQKSILGDLNGVSTNFPEIGMQEYLVLAPLTVLIFFIGIYPKPLLMISEPAVQGLIHLVTK